MACAAQSNSMAMTVCAFRSTRQHFCELIDPMLLWSSWFAESGSNRRSRGERALCFPTRAMRQCIVRSSKPELRPPSRVRIEEAAQRPVHHPLDAALGNICQLGQCDRGKIHRKSDRLSMEIAPLEVLRSSGKINGLSFAELIFDGNYFFHVLQRVARCAVHLGAHRREYASWTRWSLWRCDSRISLPWQEDSQIFLPPRAI